MLLQGRWMYQSNGCDGLTTAKNISFQLLYKHRVFVISEDSFSVRSCILYWSQASEYLLLQLGRHWDRVLLGYILLAVGWGWQSLLSWQSLELAWQGVLGR